MTETISGIYKIQSISHPERCYIGSAINIHVRWRMHTNQLKTNKHHSIKLQRHFNKYGLSDLVFSIVYECEKGNLIAVEQFYIDSHKCYFNCSPTAGSTLGSKRTPEQMLHLRGWKHTEEAKKKMSIAQKGKKRSPESIKKIRQGHIGKPLSEETKRKISESHKGIVNSAEAIEKIRQANLGRKNPHTKEWNEKISKAQKGRKLTEEHKAKLSKAKVGYIPWNKGLKIGYVPWNKGKKGYSTSKKGKVKVNGVFVCQN